MRNEFYDFLDVCDELVKYSILTKDFTLGAMLYLLVLIDGEILHGWIYLSLKGWQSYFGYITKRNKRRFDRLPYIEAEQKKIDGIPGTYYHLNREVLDRAMGKLENRN